MPIPNRNLEGSYRYKYQGQEKDPETGLNAIQLRMYDARIGRWLVPDPKSDFFSPYLAMGNKWLNMVDYNVGTVTPADNAATRIN